MKLLILVAASLALAQPAPVPVPHDKVLELERVANREQAAKQFIAEVTDVLSPRELRELNQILLGPIQEEKLTRMVELCALASISRADVLANKCIVQNFTVSRAPDPPAPAPAPATK